MASFPLTFARHTRVLRRQFSTADPLVLTRVSNKVRADALTLARHARVLRRQFSTADPLVLTHVTNNVKTIQMNNAKKLNGWTPGMMDAVFGAMDAAMVGPHFQLASRPHVRDAQAHADRNNDPPVVTGRRRSQGRDSHRFRPLLLRGSGSRRLTASDAAEGALRSPWVMKMNGAGRPLALFRLVAAELLFFLLRTGGPDGRILGDWSRWCGLPSRALRAPWLFVELTPERQGYGDFE